MELTVKEKVTKLAKSREYRRKSLESLGRHLKKGQIKQNLVKKYRWIILNEQRVRIWHK